MEQGDWDALAGNVGLLAFRVSQAVGASMEKDSHRFAISLPGCPSTFFFLEKKASQSWSRLPEPTLSIIL